MKLRFAVTTGVFVLVAASPAYALRSIQGSDYTEDFNGIKQLRVCDKESDGHGVRGDHVLNGSRSVYTIYDGNGANNACEESGVYPKTIYKHRAVEVVPMNNDAEGPWVYPS